MGSAHNCPASAKVLYPKADPDYLTRHPEDLLPDGVTEKAKLRKPLELAAAKKIHWIRSLHCKKGHPGNPAPPHSSMDLSANWAGYQSLTADTGSDYLYSYMAWTVPTVRSTGTSSIWPGVGSGYWRYDSLIQGGTEQDATICSNGSCDPDATYYYAWYEIFPQEYQQEVTDMPISPGDDMSATIWYIPETASGEIYVLDYTTGLGINVEQQIEGDDQYAPGSGQQAEWIVERTEEGGVYPPLANIGTETIGAASTTLGYSWYGNTYDYPFGDPALQSRDQWMKTCDGSILMAYPGAPSEDNYSFDVTWANEGTTDQANDTCNPGQTV